MSSGSADRRISASGQVLDIEEAADETTKLLGSHGDETQAGEPDEEEANATGNLPSSKSVVSVLSLLLIGTFIAQADGSMVMATVGTIASEFSQLENSVWLMTSYTLAMSATMPVLGKMSDIFGRKGVLLTSYAVFALGTIWSGLGTSVWHVVAGRAIAGIGGGGMAVVVSVLITGLVPRAELASWRSYINVVATTGRSVGGPLGGWLADSIGWRWSFIGQAPIIAVAFFLVLWRLAPSKCTASNSSVKAPSRLSRIDFAGAITLSTSTFTFLLALSFSPSSALFSGFLACSAVLALAFYTWESQYAREPIFPPHLLPLRDIWTSYSITALTYAAQLAAMFSVPLYFQATAGASNTAAGAHLVPAVVGNALGGLIAGYYIRRTGHYKFATTFASVSSMISYALLVLRWRGNTGILESFYIMPGGFGAGVAASSTFISLTARLEHKDIAAAVGGYYLAGSLGMIIGTSTSSGIQRATLKADLLSKLVGEGTRKIIESVLGDVSYIQTLEGPVKEIILGSYLRSLEWSHGFSFLCSATAFVLSLVIDELPLKD